MRIVALLAACSVVLPAVARADDPAPILARRPVPVVPAVAPSRQATVDADSTPRPRAKAVEYSEWYGRRVTLHRWTAYATLPAFAWQYYLGDKLINGTATQGQRDAHSANAALLAGLFTVNTATGLWNLWDARKDPNDRAARFLHTAAMLAADGIFLYAGTMLDDDGPTTGARKRQHRSLALTGMGITVASGTFMRFFR